MCSINLSRKKLSLIKYNQKLTPPGGLEPPTFRLTAERASQLRHGGLHTMLMLNLKELIVILGFVHCHQAFSMADIQLTKSKLKTVKWEN